MTETENKAFHAIIDGRVQGVGFRYSARRKAANLNITGWIRNNPDGTVEILAEGAPERLSAFLSWLKSGPSFAYVSKVDHKPVRPRGTYRNFSIVP